MLQLRIQICLAILIGLGLLACGTPPLPTTQATDLLPPTQAPMPMPTSVPPEPTPTPTPPQPVTATLAPARDNTLYQDDAGLRSNGAGQHLFAGTTAAGSLRRAVIAFDIAGTVPAGSTITSASLTLNVSRTNSGEQVITLHPLLASWGEGNSDAPGNEGSGAPSTEGDVTWIHRFFDSEEWVEPGGDFSPAASASLTVSDLGKYTWGPTPEMVSEVQTWLDNPASNFGWLLKGNEEERSTTKRFDSRENADPGVSPLLIVEYLPPPGP